MIKLNPIEMTEITEEDYREFLAKNDYVIIELVTIYSSKLNFALYPRGRISFRSDGGIRDHIGRMQTLK